MQRAMAWILGATMLAQIAPAQAPLVTATPEATVAPAQPQFALGAMNVYRRFAPAQTTKMVDFYQKVLALRPLQPIQLDPSQQIILFAIGKGQIKLAPGLKADRHYHLGGVHEGTGIRLFALTYADDRALAARFREAGYPAPAFRELGDGRRAALVQDPAGFTIELIVDPDGAASGVDVGINVADLEKSRAFYRSFVGLEELPPMRDGVLGVTKYPFRHGETTISLWSIGKKLPADTGSAGIQYVVSNVDAVNAKALAEHVTVETPLGGLPNFTIRFVWLNDPDGVTNYFAQPGPKPAGQ
ncbi:MAG: VOC family protein [Sphingomonas sp.]|nr:VOC family protein [Sphingomonas sp.]